MCTCLHKNWKQTADVQQPHVRTLLVGVGSCARAMKKGKQPQLHVLKKIKNKLWEED